MLKDIHRPEVKNIVLAAVKEPNEESGTMEWHVYLVNLNDEVIRGVLVSSKGYGELDGKEVKTSILRHLIGNVDPQDYARIEMITSNSYQWNFTFPSNDPAFQSTQRDPVFTFPKSGVYNVLLRAVRGSDQCFDTIIQKVSVFENKIEPEFSYRLNGCDLDKDSLTILLTDNSIFNEPGYQISSWQWKVTQNGVETNYCGRNPDIFVADEGNITVELLLQASNGCQSSLLKTINILELVPKLDFEVVFDGCPEQDSIQLNIILRGHKSFGDFG